MGGNGAIRWRGGLPLSRDAAFETTDPDVAVAGATELLGPHRLGLPAGAEGFSARVNARQWSDVMIAYFAYGAEVQVMASPLSELYAVNLPLTGHADVRYRGVRVDASPGSAAVAFSTVDRSWMRWSADHSLLCVTVRGAALERHLARMLGGTVDRPLRFVPEVSLRDGGRSWVGVVQTLLDFAERVPATAQSPLVAAELEAMVMTSLLLTQPHTCTEALLDDPPAVPDRVVRAAIEIMRAAPTARLTVATLAEQVGVSERSLQVAFRRHTGMPPSRFLRDVRLESARDALAATPPDQRSVARIATDHGFANLGRFAAYYRRRYGENPSETGRPSAR